MQEFQHVSSATFIANPARDADVHVQVQIVIEFVLLASKAMHYTSRFQGVSIRSQYWQKTRMRVALMQKNGFAGHCGQFQMLLEDFFPVVDEERNRD